VQTEMTVSTMPNDIEPRFLAIARIVRSQGRKGEVAAEILTDFPERFGQTRQVFLEDPGGEPRACKLEATWEHKGRIILKLAGIDSISAAGGLRGRLVMVAREDGQVMPPHRYFIWELTGCQVFTEREGTRREIGKVTDVESTAGADLLHVATPSGEVLIPFAQEICKTIDPDAKYIVIDPPEGLLELNPPGA
jgi:16S rRNA processing protein RimM